jgi:hypothetical protein
MPDLDQLDVADSVFPDDLRRLAELEWRSRTNAWDLYVASGNELSTVIEASLHTIAAWEQVHRRAFLIANRCWPDEMAMVVGAQAIEQAVLTEHSLIRPQLQPGTRMYLGRAWRVWLRDVALSS